MRAVLTMKIPLLIEFCCSSCYWMKVARHFDDFFESPTDEDCDLCPQKKDCDEENEGCLWWYNGPLAHCNGCTSTIASVRDGAMFASRPTFHTGHMREED